MQNYSHRNVISFGNYGDKIYTIVCYLYVLICGMLLLIPDVRGGTLALARVDVGCVHAHLICIVWEYVIIK